MSGELSRRSFLTGAGAVGATAAVAAAMAGVATTASVATAAEAGENTPANYLTYANPDEIGIVHDAASEETFDAVFVGTGLGGMMGAMIVAEQVPDAKILLVEKLGYVGGYTNYAERNAPNAGEDWEDALRDGIATASAQSYLLDGYLYAERNRDYAANSGWMYLKHHFPLHKAETSIPRPMYGGGNGASIISVMNSEIEAGGDYANIDLRLNTRATALLLEDEYTCTGVQILNEDGTYTNVNAKAVVLGTGGMSSNFDLLQHYSGQDLGKCEVVVGTGHDGDGHLMVEQTAHGDCMNVALSSMYTHVKGMDIDDTLSVAAGMNSTCLFVNQDGVRFIDESSPSDVARCKAIEQQGRVYSIIGTTMLDEYAAGGLPNMKGMVGDDRGYEEWDPYAAIEKYKDSDEMFIADTLEELAELIDVPADALVETVQQYDADCAAGEGDTVLGKPADYMMALGDGPFYAFHLTSVIFNTNSGIRINRNAQVVDPYHKPVEGLYALGIACSGFNTGELYFVGTCQASSAWAGSKAARHLVEHCLGGTVSDDWYGDSPYVAGMDVTWDDGSVGPV